MATINSERRAPCSEKPQERGWMIAPAGKGEHQHYTPYLHPAIPFGHEYLSKSKVMTSGGFILIFGKTNTVM